MIYQYVGWKYNDWNDQLWGIYKIRPSRESNLIFNCVAFWGRRREKFKTEFYNYYSWEIRDQIKHKINNGYNEFQPTEYSIIYDEFSKDLDKILILVSLKLSI